MKRRGQFYMIDAFFASVILFAGISALLAGFVTTPDQRQPQIHARDVSNILVRTQLGEIGNTYIVANSDTIDEFLSPVEQAQLWIYEDEPTYTARLAEAQSLIASIVDPLTENQWNVQINLVLRSAGEVRQIYPAAVFVPPEQANVRIVERDIIATVDGPLLHGPDTLEVNIWG